MRSKINKHQQDALEETLDVKTKNEQELLKLQEIYGKYTGIRRTIDGRRIRFDEPATDDAQLRQSDAIRAAVQKKRAAASRTRLKAADKVPTRNGKKLFEHFINDIRPYSSQKKSRNELPLVDLRNIYNASRELSFNQWILYLQDTL